MIWICNHPDPSSWQPGIWYGAFRWRCRQVAGKGHWQTQVQGCARGCCNKRPLFSGFHSSDFVSIWSWCFCHSKVVPLVPAVPIWIPCSAVPGSVLRGRHTRIVWWKAHWGQGERCRKMFAAVGHLLDSWAEVDAINQILLCIFWKAESNGSNHKLSACEIIRLPTWQGPIFVLESELLYSVWRISNSCSTKTKTCKLGKCGKFAK